MREYLSHLILSDKLQNKEKDSNEDIVSRAIDSVTCEVDLHDVVGEMVGFCFYEDEFVDSEFWEDLGHSFEQHFEYIFGVDQKVVDDLVVKLFFGQGEFCGLEKA